jgi:hypothetical protein
LEKKVLKRSYGSFLWIFDFWRRERKGGRGAMVNKLWGRRVKRNRCSGSYKRVSLT